MITILLPGVESKQLVGNSSALEEEAMMATCFLRDGSANKLFARRKT
jgi:hypothetical protein